jgi:hypothetical protein
MLKTKILFILLVGSLLVSSTAGANISLIGRFNDPGDPCIIGPEQLGADAVFTSHSPDSVNNVMVYSFHVINPTPVRFQTFSFGLGGIDPYFSLFSGTGHDATFLRSNYDQAIDTGGDIDMAFPLLADDYTVALSARTNMSSAEDYGFGTLGDGFTGLGAYIGSRNPMYYNLEISIGSTLSTPVPEPGTLGLLAFGISALIGLRRHFLI